MKIKLIFIFFLTFILIFFTFANQNSGKKEGDCDNISNILGVRFVEFKYIDKEILNVAMDNLKSFCNFLNGKGKPKGAWSPYLADHLLDVAFRKLDGIPELSYIGVDPDGKARRKFIKENLVYQPASLEPQVILKEYKKYWKIEEKDKGILVKKYFDVCWDIKRLYELYILRVDGYTYNFDQVENVCIQVVYKRIWNENFYIKQWINRKGVEKVFANFWKYSIEDFIKKDFIRLFEKYSQMLGYFRVVVQKVIEGTKNCNQ